MLLMRIYPPLAKDSLDELVPAMVKALEMPRPQEASRNAKCGTIYEYMVMCQTKTLSFLTHLLKDSHLSLGGMPISDGKYPARNSHIDEAFPLYKVLQ